MNEVLKLNLCFAFSELFKGLAGKDIAQLQTKLWPLGTSNPIIAKLNYSIYSNHLSALMTIIFNKCKMLVIFLHFRIQYIHFYFKTFILNHKHCQLMGCGNWNPNPSILLLNISLENSDPSIFTDPRQQSKGLESMRETQIWKQKQSQEQNPESLGMRPMQSSQKCVLNRQKPPQSILEIQLKQHDRREINHNYGYPYNCILTLKFTKIVQKDKQIVTATGALISPKIVITSAHFLEAHQQCRGNATTIMAYSQLQAELGLTQDMCYNNMFEADFYSFMPQYSKDLKQIEYDFGFIKLKFAIDRPKYISIALNFQFTNYSAELCGATKSRQMKMTGIIEKFEDTFLEYDIDTSFGQSGAPILVIFSFCGIVIIIGTHSGYYYSGKINGKTVKHFIKLPVVSYKPDSGNSGCRLTNMHKNFLIDSLRSHLSKQSQAFITQFLSKITFIDLSSIPTIKFPKKYFVRRQQVQAQNPQVQFRQIRSESLRIQNSRVFPMLPSLVSAIPANDFLVSLRTAKQHYKEYRNHQSLSQCFKAVGNIKENNLLLIQFLDLIGLNYQELNNPHIAKIFYKKCVELASEARQYDIMNSPGFLSIIKIFHNLGVMELEEENLEKAKDFFEKCLRCLFVKNYDKTEHYAATNINLSLVLLKKNLEKSQKIIERLKASLKILDSVSNESNSQIIGKIQAIRNILKIYFEQGRYEEWLKFIFEKMETIVLMKVEEGIYDRLDDKPIDSSRIEELHRVEYAEKNLKIDKNHHLPTYLVSWCEQWLHQVDKLLRNYKMNEVFELNLCFAFSEIFKGMAGKDITQLQTKIVALRNKQPQ